MSTRNAVLSLLFLVAVPLGCDTAVDDTTPRSEADAASLLGLTDAELTLVWEVSDVDASLDEWLERHHRPFDCADVGDFCSLVGKEVARDILHESYQRIIDGQSIDEVQQWLEAEIQTVAANSPEPEVTFRAILHQSFNQHGNARTRVRAYTILPPAPFQGYAYGQCKHQTRKNSGAAWVNRTANHVASVRSRRSTVMGDNVLNGPVVPGAGYTKNNGTAITVTSGNNLHGIGPWTLPLGGVSLIQARACCQTFGEGDFPENIWCVGSTEEL